MNFEECRVRIKTRAGDQDAPQIDPAAVESFFSKRAEKAKTLGSLRAVIYQDKHPDLAERRDAAEKALLLPKLELQAHSRVLDIGCGTGRWTGVLASQVDMYHGTDFAAGLVDIARAEHDILKNVHYFVLPSVAVSLRALGESQGFDRIVVFGLLIYLNEQDVFETLRRVVEVAAPQCRLLIREPVAIGSRLTIKEHFSDDLEQVYNAIYRTEDELLFMIAETLEQARFKVIESGYVYEQREMNNRADTVQKWYLLERREGN
jgi:cyclopropane fatty-acyl-phospholipid synthase-like methyltransferase